MKPVTSDGVYEAIKDFLKEFGKYPPDTDTVQDELHWDDSVGPNPDSVKPVTSRAIYAALQALKQEIEGSLIIPADYIVEEGTCLTDHDTSIDSDDSDAYQSTSQSYNISNVTWFWRKWNSGKIECWASHEVSWYLDKSWGNLWRGRTFARQELPFVIENEQKKYLLIDTPEVCQIDVVGDVKAMLTVRAREAEMNRTRTCKFFPVESSGTQQGVSHGSYVHYYVSGRWK
jgi:hypothetical protein